MDSQNPNPSNDQNSNPNPRPQPARRRPRGIAARMAGDAASATANNSRKFLERERQAITARMLDGLRQYDNFNLPPRADLNLVVGALAREAGFTVDPDGAAYRL